jgi:hypothetical protein
MAPLPRPLAGLASGECARADTVLDALHPADQSLGAGQVVARLVLTGRGLADASGGAGQSRLAREIPSARFPIRARRRRNDATPGVAVADHPRRARLRAVGSRAPRKKKASFRIGSVWDKCPSTGITSPTAPLYPGELSVVVGGQDLPLERSRTRVPAGPDYSAESTRTKTSSSPPKPTRAGRPMVG